MDVNQQNEKEKEKFLIPINNYINKDNHNSKKQGIETFINKSEILFKNNKIKPNQFTLEKIIVSRFNKKYKRKYNPTHIYNELIMYTLLFNKNTHLVSVFKDYMIFDYVDEFLKRFYNIKETLERLPKFAMFYKNYLTFFCQPSFCNFHYNGLIQKNREKKAEIFYNKNFRENKKESGEDEGIIEDTDDEEEDGGADKSKIDKTIFNETVKKKIEKYSPINNSMALPESETHLKNDQSGLLISFDNESSLRNILKNMINKKKIFKNNYGEDISVIKKSKVSYNGDTENINKIQENKNNSNNKMIITKNNKDKDKVKNSINKDYKNNKINITINDKKNFNKILKK